MHWTPTHTLAPLQSGHVQLVRVSLAALWPKRDALALLLNPAERARASAFKFAQHKGRFVVTHGVLRQCLAALTGIAPTDIAFQHNAQGKPELAQRSDVQFNLSHTGDWAVFAFSQHGPLGVDIEIIKNRPFLELARRFFAPEECAALNALSRSQQKRAFFFLWTQKEAYIKATGLGLSAGLDRFCVSAAPPSRLIHIDNDQSAVKDWVMHEFSIQDDILGHLAIQYRDVQMDYLSFSL